MSNLLYVSCNVFAENRFFAVMKQVPGTLIFAVEIDDISREQVDDCFKFNSRRSVSKNDSCIC